MPQFHTVEREELFSTFTYELRETLYGQKSNLFHNYTWLVHFIYNKQGEKSTGTDAAWKKNLSFKTFADRL